VDTEEEIKKRKTRKLRIYKKRFLESLINRDIIMETPNQRLTNFFCGSIVSVRDMDVLMKNGATFRIVGIRNIRTVSRIESLFDNRRKKVFFLFHGLKEDIPLNILAKGENVFEAYLRAYRKTGLSLLFIHKMEGVHYNQDVIISRRSV